MLSILMHVMYVGIDSRGKQMQNDTKSLFMILRKKQVNQTHITSLNTCKLTGMKKDPVMKLIKHFVKYVTKASVL